MGKRIIIRTPNYIGDTIMTLPALELLRIEYPDATFTIVCKPHSAAVFRKKGIEKFILDETKGKRRLWKTWELIRKLRKEPYDLGVLFHNSFLNALVFRLARVGELVGYNNENRKILLSFSLSLDRSWHYANRYAHLVNQYLKDKYERLPKVTLFCEPSECVRRGEKPLVGFVLGGENKGTRSYPKKLALQLFDKLAKEDFDIVLLGDKQDSVNHDSCEMLLRKNGVQVTNLTGKTNVAEFIDAIATLDLLVTIDTSAMHIAAATDTEFIVLSGRGTSPLSVVFPKDGQGHIMEKGQHCVRGEDMIGCIVPEDIYTKIVEIVNKKVTFGNKSS